MCVFPDCEGLFGLFPPVSIDADKLDAYWQASSAQTKQKLPQRHRDYQRISQTQFDSILAEERFDLAQSVLSALLMDIFLRSAT